MVADKQGMRQQDTGKRRPFGIASLELVGAEEEVIAVEATGAGQRLRDDERDASTRAL